MNNLNPLFEAHAENLPFLSRAGHKVQSTGYKVSKATPYIFGPLALGAQMFLKNPAYRTRLVAGGTAAAAAAQTSMLGGRMLRGLSARVKGHGRSLKHFQNMVQDRDMRKESAKAAKETVGSALKKGIHTFVTKKIPGISKMLDAQDSVPTTTTRMDF